MTDNLPYDVPPSPPAQRSEVAAVRSDVRELAVRVSNLEVSHGDHLLENDERIDAHDQDFKLMRATIEEQRNRLTQLESYMQQAISGLTRLGLVMDRVDRNLTGVVDELNRKRETAA